MAFGRAFRLVAIGLGVLVIVLASICGFLVFRTRSFLADSSTATGQVIALVARQSCDHDTDENDGNGDRRCTTVYAPRVRFTARDGRQVEFTSGTASSSLGYAEGDPVDVRYRSDHPGDARIDSVTGLWLGPIITGALALVFAGVCVVWIRLAVRFRNE